MKKVVVIIITLILLLSGCSNDKVENLHPNQSIEKISTEGNLPNKESIIEVENNKSEYKIVDNNWINHPEIIKVRNIYNEIESSIKDYKEIKNINEYTVPSMLIEQVFYIDSQNQIRKYTKSGGSADSALSFSFYYDKNGTLRFVFINGGAVNGSQLEHRIYYNTNGKRMWEIQKYIEGPEYAWPETLSDDSLVFDPTEELNKVKNNK